MDLRNGSQCPNTTHLVDTLKRTYLPAMYGMIFIVGLVGNLAALAVYLLKIRPFSSSSIIMINLTVADLLYVLSLPFMVHYYATREWEFGDFMCWLVRSCYFFHLYGSIFLLTVLSVFRYVVVLYPLKAERVSRASFGVRFCLAAWLLCVLLLSPMYSLLREGAREGGCIDFASCDNVWVYGWILTTVGFLIPLLVVCLSYSCVARALSSGLLPPRPAHQQARRLSVLTLLMFVVCFSPYHVLRLVRIGTRMRSSCALEAGVHAAYIISRPLAPLNTLFNLALYSLAGGRFNQAVRSLFRWNDCPFYKASQRRGMVLTVCRPRGSSCNELIQN